MTEHDMTEREALEARLAEIKREEAEQARLAREAVVPVWSYTWAPDAGREARRNSRSSFDRLYDDSVSVWRLEGTCTNAAEMAAVARSHEAEGGGMSYLLNRATGKIITSVSGGRIFLQAAESMQALADWAFEHPEGGDVTELVTALRESAPEVEARQRW